MARIAVRFRDGFTATISEEAAEQLAVAWGAYQDTKHDSIVKIANRRIKLSLLDSMETIAEPSTTPIRGIDRAMAASAASDTDPATKTLKEQQLAIFRHNKRCIAERKLDAFVWYKIVASKLVRITKAEAQQRANEQQKRSIAERPGVHHVTERGGQLEVGLA